MTAKPIATHAGKPVLSLSLDTTTARLAPPPSRRSSADSYTSPVSASDSPPRSSTAGSRRPSLSRHQSFAASPKVGLHPVESFLDLAQTSAAAHASLLNHALLNAAAKPLTSHLKQRPGAEKARAHTAPIAEVPNGSHAWYTDRANPIVAGLTLRQTVASGIAPHVSHMPGGVQLVHMVLPRQIDALVATDLKVHGQSRFAAQLIPDLRTNKLLKIKYNGTVQTAKDGYYACIIDQNNTLLVSVIAASTAGAPAGAHANLAGGLPVRFAGELRIADGRVVWLNNASGHYRTPFYLIDQALAQPLLTDAQVDFIGI